ncbi:acid protease [Schizophyllum commune H4-8]|nr:acid protease [Schizophyllum commune H4-8]KAI5895030.1 acid protease [Schizophyllum commune H4-8]
MFSSRLYCLLLLAVTVVASPVVEPRADATVNLPLTLQRNVTGGQEMVSAGRQRAQALRAYGNGQRHHPADEPVFNQNVVYTAPVGVGSAGETCKYNNLIVDTGSSNTWVGAAKSYEPSDTSQDTDEPVEVTYGSGFFLGTEWIDRVSLSRELVVHRQSIGVARYSRGIGPKFDGILGLGPTDLTAGSLVFSPGEEIPTVTDNLYTQGNIQQPALGVYFAPAASQSPGGVLTFGSADDTFPKTTTSPASAYWGYDQSITYNGTTILSQASGIADTGTTLIYLPTDAYNMYVAQTGAVPDRNTGLLSVTEKQFKQMKSLVFNVNGVDYELVPDAQLWPRSRNADIGGTPKGYYLVVASMGSPEGQGLDFINGYAFLERFYSYYDTANAEMGFATTKYTNATVNSQTQ